MEKSDSSGKTLRWVAFWQLVATEFAQLLDWYDSDVGHKSFITNTIVLPTVMHRVASQFRSSSSSLLL
jgi:hypothetical protein